MPLLAGLSMTHAFLPPHPGPVAAAGLFHVSLGWVILMGASVGIPSVLAAWGYAAWIGKRIFVPVPQDMVEAAAEAKAAVAAEQRAAGVTPREEPVPLGTVLAIIGTPLVLILRRHVLLDRAGPLAPARSVLEFFGNPFVALTIALLLAYYLLGIRRGWSRKSLERCRPRRSSRSATSCWWSARAASSARCSRPAASRTRWPPPSTTSACR